MSAVTDVRVVVAVMAALGTRLATLSRLTKRSGRSWR